MEPKTFTQQELDTACSIAVNDAVNKVKHTVNVNYRRKKRNQEEQNRRTLAAVDDVLILVQTLEGRLNELKENVSSSTAPTLPEPAGGSGSASPPSNVTNSAKASKEPPSPPHGHPPSPPSTPPGKPPSPPPPLHDPPSPPPSTLTPFAQHSPLPSHLTTNAHAINAARNQYKARMGELGKETLTPTDKTKLKFLISLVNAPDKLTLTSTSEVNEREKENEMEIVKKFFEELFTSSNTGTVSERYAGLVYDCCRPLPIFLLPSLSLASNTSFLPRNHETWDDVVKNSPQIKEGMAFGKAKSLLQRRTYPNRNNKKDTINCTICSATYNFNTTSPASFPKGFCDLVTNDYKLHPSNKLTRPTPFLIDHKYLCTMSDSTPAQSPEFSAYQMRKENKVKELLQYFNFPILEKNFDKTAEKEVVEADGNAAGSTEEKGPTKEKRGGEKEKGDERTEEKGPDNEENAQLKDIGEGGGPGNEEGEGEGGEGSARIEKGTGGAEDGTEGGEGKEGEEGGATGKGGVEGKGERGEREQEMKKPEREKEERPKKRKRKNKKGERRERREGGTGKGGGRGRGGERVNH